jgi:hypothetical protein
VAVYFAKSTTNWGGGRAAVGAELAHATTNKPVLPSSSAAAEPVPRRRVTNAFTGRR